MTITTYVDVLNYYIYTQLMNFSSFLWNFFFWNAKKSNYIIFVAGFSFKKKAEI